MMQFAEEKLIPATLIAGDGIGPEIVEDSSNARLREEFQLYANVRRARTLLRGGRYEDIDVVLVRENLEELYVGFEHYIPIGDDPHAVAIGSGVNTGTGCRRIAEYAFEYAVRTGDLGGTASTKEFVQAIVASAKRIEK